MKALRTTLTVGLFCLSLMGSAQGASKGAAAAFPWVFSLGTETSRKTAMTSASEIAQKAGFAVISSDQADKAWEATGLARPTAKKLPTKKQLQAFCKEAKVVRALYGSVAWHTRSIWVGAGPKTISTATVSVYVYDAKSDKVIYQKTGVSARSDEKEDTLKVIGAVLVSPLVTAVSGGPATPREQRAVQIALARAYQGWVAPKK